VISAFGACAAAYTLDTYYPEVGRDGDGECVRAAKAVFAADSAAALAQFRLLSVSQHRARYSGSTPACCHGSKSGSFP